MCVPKTGNGPGMAGDLAENHCQPACRKPFTGLILFHLKDCYSAAALPGPAGFGGIAGLDWFSRSTLGPVLARVLRFPRFRNFFESRVITSTRSRNEWGFTSYVEAPSSPAR